MIDAHHHVWDPGRNYYPWLSDEPPIRFRYGDYSAIRRPYLPEDYRRDARPYRLLASVYVEAEWDPRDPVGEMDYIAALRAETGLPSVAVAQAWLDRDDCAAVLESHAARGFVRSVRHKPRANASPADGAAGGMTDPRWREGFARLAPLGLRFDLQTPWWHLGEAARLAADFPETTIILNHTGLPADRSPEGLAGWNAAMQRLAACPNVMVKISGIGIPGQRWTAEANREVVLRTIDAFGSGRCMFASNFPVDSLCAGFSEIFGGFEAIVAGFPQKEQEALFVENARRIYATGEGHA
ncbi:MAG: amidohydrolase family protein [Beijerinckiaceae bacterium]|nr:amidohydrolase family protein [Beijerinckiaceae bacterium]